MQAAAGLVGKGLWHKAGMQAVAAGDGAHDLLEHHYVVGRFKRACVAKINLVLAVAAFVVAVLGRKAHFFHREANLAAHVFARVQRRDVEIAAVVDGRARGPALVVLFKQIELDLRADVAGQPERAAARRLRAQDAAAVALEARAVGTVHIAEQLHHAPFRRPPRQYRHGGKVGPEDEVAFLHVHEARDGTAVEADAVGQCLGQIARGDGDVFLHAEDIAEGKTNELYVVVLHKIQNILCIRVAHGDLLRKLAARVRLLESGLL